MAPHGAWRHAVVARLDHRDRDEGLIDVVAIVEHRPEDLQGRVDGGWVQRRRAAGRVEYVQLPQRLTVTQPKRAHASKAGTVGDPPASKDLVVGGGDLAGAPGLQVREIEGARRGVGDAEVAGGVAGPLRLVIAGAGDLEAGGLAVRDQRGLHRPRRLAQHDRSVQRHRFELNRGGLEDARAGGGSHVEEARSRQHHRAIHPVVAQVGRRRRGQVLLEEVDRGSQLATEQPRGSRLGSRRGALETGPRRLDPVALLGEHRRRQRDRASRPMRLEGGPVDRGAHLVQVADGGQEHRLIAGVLSERGKPAHVVSAGASLGGRKQACLRADADDGVDGLAAEGPDAVDEAHWGAGLPAPVGRVDGGEGLAGDVRDEGDRWRRHADAGSGGLEGVERRVDLRRVERDRGGEPSDLNPAPLEHRDEVGDGLPVAGDHRVDRRVHRGDAQPRARAGRAGLDRRVHLGPRRADRRHRAVAGDRVHQAAPVGGEAEAGLEVHHLRGTRRRQLAEAVAEDHRRRHPPAAEGLHQPPLQREHRGLGVHRAVEALYAAHRRHVLEEQGAEIELVFEHRVGAIDHLAEHRLGVIEAAPHADVLSALAAEDERDLRCCRRRCEVGAGARRLQSRVELGA